VLVPQTINFEKVKNFPGLGQRQLRLLALGPSAVGPVERFATIRKRLRRLHQNYAQNTNDQVGAFLNF